MGDLVLLTMLQEDPPLQWRDELQPSYYVGTAGNVSAEAIKNYIEETKNL